MNSNNPLVNSNQISAFMDNGEYRTMFIHMFSAEIVWSYQKKNKTSSDLDFLSRKVKLLTFLTIAATLALAVFAFLAFESSTLVGIGLSLATAYCGFRSAISILGQRLFFIFKAIKMKDLDALASVNKEDAQIMQIYVDKAKNINLNHQTTTATT